MIMNVSFPDKLPNPVQKRGEFQVVKTPSPLAGRILDCFPKHVWNNPNLKWLVPVSKNGVFELHIFLRLMYGLVSSIPDADERRRHIITEMIWSFAPTPACELVVRRNYLCKAWGKMEDFMGLE